MPVSPAPPPAAPAGPAATPDPASGFAIGYAQARTRFLVAASNARLSVAQELHPLRGAEGEALAIDAALDGDPQARRLLIVSSGCHGVEGQAGSGAQVSLLRDASLRDAARKAGVALLYLHALNPHGFSWGRRVTHENVDLNRNVVDFRHPPAPHPLWRRLAPLLVPAQWPPPLANRLALYAFALRHGLRATQAALSQGQYEQEQALFFGGFGPSWSQSALRRLLRHFGAQAQALAWIDLHTGLGPPGVGERIHAAPLQPDTLARARAWWGPGLTVAQQGSSSSAAVTGEIWHAALEECPQAQFTGLVLEFGTQARLKVLDALRGDQWLRQHPEAPPTLQTRIRRRMREAFYLDEPGWQAAVVAQTSEAVRLAIGGLAARA